MSVVKVVELVGTSSRGWQEATQAAIEEASHSLRHITGVDVIKQTAHVEDGKITEYRTTLNVAFVIEHPSQLVGVGTHAESVRS